MPLYPQAPPGSYDSPAHPLASAVRTAIAANMNAVWWPNFSDSTDDDGGGFGPHGTDLTEHSYQRFLLWSGLFPSFSFVYGLWNDAISTSGGYNRPRRITTGTAGRRYIGMTGISGMYLSTPHTTDMDFTGDFRIEVEARVDTPYATPLATDTIFLSRDSTYGLHVTTGGNLQVWWYEPGNIQLTAPAPVSAAAGVYKWYAVDFDADNGTGGTTATFYESNDGITWTSLGSATRAGATATIAVTTNKLQMGARGASGTVGFWAGRFHSAYLYSGIGANNKLVAAPMADLLSDNVAKTQWYDQTGKLWTMTGSGLGTYTRGGSLGFLFLNTATAGKYLDYHSDATRFPLLTPFPDALDNTVATNFNAPSCLGFDVAHSHNGGTASGSQFLVDLDNFVTTLMLAKYKYAIPVIHAQNPQPSDQANYQYHASRCRAALQYAAAKRWPAVNAFQAFLNYGATWNPDLILSGVHPNQAGEDLWAATARNALRAIETATV